MTKLGDVAKINKFNIGKYSVEEVWLTRYIPTGKYQVMGLCRDEDKTSKGWWTLWETDILAKARQYIRELQDPTMTTYICGNC